MLAEKLADLVWLVHESSEDFDHSDDIVILCEDIADKCTMSDDIAITVGAIRNAYSGIE